MTDMIWFLGSGAVESPAVSGRDPAPAPAPEPAGLDPDAMLSEEEALAKAQAYYDTYLAEDDGIELSPDVFGLMDYGDGPSYYIISFYYASPEMSNVSKWFDLYVDAYTCEVYETEPKRGGTGITIKIRQTHRFSLASAGCFFIFGYGSMRYTSQPPFPWT